jgi:hypothetical protein
MSNADSEGDAGSQGSLTQCPEIVENRTRAPFSVFCDVMGGGEDKWNGDRGSEGASKTGKPLELLSVCKVLLSQVHSLRRLLRSAQPCLECSTQWKASLADVISAVISMLLIKHLPEFLPTGSKLLVFQVAKLFPFNELLT